MILDGVGYRAEHDSCEALSRYASGLLEAEDAPLLLKEPPALTAVCGDTAAGALLGTYSWQWQAPSGSWEGIASDSAHPLDCQEFLLPLETEEETAVLRFQAEPAPSRTSAAGATPTGLTPARRRSPARSTEAPSS